MLSLIVERALRGEASPRADLDFLEDSPALDELVEAAHLVTTKCASRVFNFCTIVNAKSGRCAEDCRWCSQSSKWTTNAPVFPIVPATRGESAAARALEHGIRRLSFVTSGRKLSARELREIRPVVEAAASTGGQIMPPIMGAGAFIMAEIIGVQYAQIAAAAVLPAVAYFLAVFILVHMIAKKKGLGKDSGVHYEGKPILPRVYRLLPIIILVIMIIMGYSLPRSAIYCTIFSIIIAAISPETRMSPRKLLQTLMDGVRQAANIAIPTAACGIMIGIVVNSGVAVKIAKLIGTSGEGSLFIALLIAALGCLLLGMALPTVAAYLIAVTLFASAIQGLGISALVTNMFIFYFGVVAQITPPVCLASFTAAGIAGASAWKTGWKAFSFAITAFIVPFAFVYRPAILLEGTVVEIVIAYCIVIAATYLLACGIAGYLFRPLKMWERIACYVVAFIFILPSSMSDIIGIAGCVLIMAYCFMTGKKNANKAQPA